MSRKAFIVTDLGFGDSGKGTITDYLCEQHGPEAVIRYSGGAQASHTVVRGDLTHRFHSYGSGTLLGIPTFISQYMMVDPIAIWEETKELGALGLPMTSELLTIDPRCIVVTPFHRALNRLQELARGYNRHGSCGMGIGVARQMDIEDPSSTLRVEDFTSQVYIDKIRRIKDLTSLAGVPYLADALKNTLRVHTVDLARLAHDASKVFVDDEELEATLEVFPAVLKMHSMGAPKLSTDQPVIFEGSQGLLIDESCGFHPHTTWSDVTSTNARKLAQSLDCISVTNIGVTRAYMARHGCGPLPTESEDLMSTLKDPNNPSNPWQGKMRYGWLDIPLLKQSLLADQVDELAVTCYDQVTGYTLPVCIDRQSTLRPQDCFGDIFKMTVLGEKLASAESTMADYRFNGGFLDFLSEQLDIPLSIVSSGPRASDKQGTDVHMAENSMGLKL